MTDLFWLALWFDWLNKTSPHYMLTMEKKLSSRGSWISIDSISTNVHCYCHNEISDFKFSFSPLFTHCFVFSKSWQVFANSAPFQLCMHTLLFLLPLQRFCCCTAQRNWADIHWLWVRSWLPIQNGLPPQMELSVKVEDKSWGEYLRLKQQASQNCNVCIWNI